MVLQQYWTESPWNTAWPREVHLYCFVKEVCMITDYKPLVAIISKDIAMLSQHLQHIMLCIHQCRVCILNKPGPNLQHSSLVMMKQIYRKQGLGNPLHEHSHACHQHISICTNMHICRRHTGSNQTGWRPKKAKVLHNTGLVIP